MRVGWFLVNVRDTDFKRCGLPGNAADLMRTMQEKIGQYIGIKYGEDIANELTNKATMTIPPPVYPTAILLRHQ
jgi:hypothetical protein